MTASVTASPPLPTTVKASLREAVREFQWLVDDADEPSASDKYQSRLVRAVTILLRLWSHIQDDGVLTRYETLRDFSDTALELLPVPYYLGILCEKRLFTAPIAADEPREQQMHSREAEARKRSEALLTGSDFLLRFLRIAVDLGLTTERDVETKPFIHSSDRQSRVQLSRERSAVEREVRELDAKLEWARQRAMRDARNGSSSEDSDDEGAGPAEGAAERQERRTQRLDDKVDALEAEEELLADSSDYAETKRRRNRRFLDWCVLDAFCALNQNNSELEMLGQLTAEEKQAAVENFRKSVEGNASPFTLGAGDAAPAAESSFSLLRMVPPGAASMSGAVNAAVSGDVRMALQQLQMPAGGNYQVLPGGHVVPFGALGAAAHTDREQVRRDAFLHRNLPTQTLAEFAAGEMEKMRQDEERQQAHNVQQAEEDARLGADGVEERERQKQAEWDDWRDANPPIGISAKGNYS